mgnify:CR=1 FL=1
MREALLALLQVQEHDTVLDQLRHRRDHLPARADLAGALASAKSVMPEHERLVAERSAILAAERRIDDDVQLQRAKAAEIEAKLYSGSVTAPKELQALQADLDALRAHIGALEDDELEQMAERERVDSELAPVVERIASLRADVERSQAAIVEGEHEIDAELAEVEGRRVEVARGVPPELLADYDTRRRANRGQGAARLVGDTCQACRLSIPATEVDQIVHDTTGAVWYCDNCGAILVAS